jgi:hypothetical protein
MKKILFCIAIACTLALSGCTSSPDGASPPEAAPNKQSSVLKNFNVDPGSAGVFVYRLERRGGRQEVAVWVDGHPIGSTRGRSFLFAELLPGEHTVTSIDGGRVATLDIEVEAGQFYYIFQELKMDEYGQHQLQLVSDGEGRLGVRMGKYRGAKRAKR